MARILLQYIIDRLQDKNPNSENFPLRKALMKCKQEWAPCIPFAQQIKEEESLLAQCELVKRLRETINEEACNQSEDQKLKQEQIQKEAA